MTDDDSTGFAHELRARAQGYPDRTGTDSESEEQPHTVHFHMVRSLFGVDYASANDIRYALSFATSIMFWMVVKKPLSGTQRRVRHSSEWS